jgi:vacuolar-type H+-ATPase subunit I/STV1
MKTNQEDLLKTVKEEMQATIRKMEAGIHSIQSELENTNQSTQNLRKKLTETIEKTQVQLQRVEAALNVQTREFRREKAAIRSDVTNAKTHGTFNETRSQIKARLEAVEARAELGRARRVGTSAVQPPTFNGNTSWSVFRRQFETVTEHNHWSDKEKSTYLITALKGRAEDAIQAFRPIRLTREPSRP